MSLTQSSIAAAARKRSERVRKHLREARAELAVANESLSEAIPTGNVEVIKEAQVHTVEAEGRLVEAEEQLDIVTTLLAPDGAGAPSANDPQAAPRVSSGNGSKSLVAQLRGK
jgi:stalled ribosome rescue protein Dom34